MCTSLLPLCVFLYPLLSLLRVSPLLSPVAAAVAPVHAHVPAPIATPVPAPIATPIATPIAAFVLPKLSIVSNKFAAHDKYDLGDIINQHLYLINICIQSTFVFYQHLYSFNIYIHCIPGVNTCFVSGVASAREGKDRKDKRNWRGPISIRDWA